MRAPSIALCLGLLAASAVSGLAASATSARLVLPVESVAPGESFLAGVELTMAPRWHTYWRNGGDSGAPTTIDWELPAGVTAGAIQWPAPERYREGDLTTYVYHGTAMLLVPITIAATIPPGPVELAARVKWLECEKLCLPGAASVKGTVLVASATRPSGAAERIRTAQERVPKSLPANAVTARWDGSPSAEERALIISWSDQAPKGTADFFPFEADGYKVLTATDELPAEAGKVVLRKKIEKSEADWPKQIAGLLVALRPDNTPARAYETTLAIDELPAPAARGALGPSTRTGSPDTGMAARAPRLSLWRAILFGLLGGLILNVMPCVLPVIALKILGFVRQSGDHPGQIRKLGLIYGLGVWFSFLVLAGVVLGVKRATGTASWGMQFGNPVFLSIMATVIVLVALSLFGVFEINLGGRTMDVAGELAGKEGPAGAFFNGMLAVALATPCTAPFLAPALGYAFAADATAIILVFSAVAVGLALPYLLLSWQPAWLRFLPKPGRWMEQFKVAMGFPMLATAIWLYTLAASSFGEGGALWLGIFLVGIALAAWVWGEFVQRGRKRQSLSMAIAVGLAALFYFYALEKNLHWREARAPATAGASGQPANREGIAWQPWSPEAILAARQEGRPVFVDFTANWCLTCKANEKFAIDVPSVRAKLKLINALTLKGDNTRLPPPIVAELQRFGRAGVPLVLVYPPDVAKEPVVLPEVLTPGLVLDALDKAIL